MVNAIPNDPIDAEISELRFEVSPSVVVVLLEKSPVEKLTSPRLYSPIPAGFIPIEAMSAPKAPNAPPIAVVRIEPVGCVIEYLSTSTSFWAKDVSCKNKINSPKNIVLHARSTLRDD